MHAVLALAAQHKSNISRMGSDLEISEKFADVSLQHRTEAFHFLRTTAAEQSDRHAPVIPVILILLILTMVSRGDFPLTAGAKGGIWDCPFFAQTDPIVDFQGVWKRLGHLANSRRFAFYLLGLLLAW